MKKSAKSFSLWPAVTVVLVVLFPHPGAAQTFSNLYSFASRSGLANTNVNGAGPAAGLVLTGNALYGAAAYGGTGGKGAVFRFSLDGSGMTNLHSFAALSGPAPATNSDGATPHGDLTLAGNVLYGTTYEGGAAGYGTVFAIQTDGTGFTNLHSFSARSGPSLTNTDGANPEGGLVVSENMIYGTTYYGGAVSGGTLFALQTDGTGFTNLHNFLGGANDGNGPQASLILVDQRLYGTTALGGNAGRGTLFAMNTNGGGYTNFYAFAGGPDDGASPLAAVRFSDGFLYGTTLSGGTHDAGTVFKVGTNGLGYATLHSFNASTGGFPSESPDGTAPQGEVVVQDGRVYGLTGSGGVPGYGVQYSVGTDGGGFTILHNNSNYADGYFGNAGLTLASNILYGVEFAGGSSGSGTIFSLALPNVGPTLEIARAGANVVLSWRTNDPGFVLQFATNLLAPIAWSNSSSAPAIVNDRNSVTNPATGTKQFYRLSR